MKEVLIALIQSLGSPSSPWIIAVIFASLCWITYMVKTGGFTVRTSRFEIGRKAAEKEQIILRRQIAHIDRSVNACMRSIPKHDQFDEWRTRFVFEKVIDQMTEWCLFNHLSLTPRYLSLKKDEVWDIIQKYTWHSSYQSDEFREYVDNFVETTIKELIEYRKEYGDE